MFPLRAIPLLGLLISSPAFAAMIDDFSTSQGPVTTPIASVSGAGILGGSREFLNGASFQAAGGMGTFSTPDGSNNIFSLGYDGSADGAFGAGGFATIDLTDGGLADILIVSVADLSTAGDFVGSASLTLWLWDADDNSAALSPMSVAGGPGLYSTALPTSGIDLTRVVRAQIPVFLQASPVSGVSLSLDYMCTGNSAGCTSPAAVPEPSAFALLGLGLAALALRRRKS